MNIEKNYKNFREKSEISKDLQGFSLDQKVDGLRGNHRHCKTLSSDFLDRTRPEKQLSRLRLMQRKKERIQIQSISKQLQNPSENDFFSINKPNPQSHLNQNLWMDLKNVPTSRLKHVLPVHVRENDLKGLNSIVARGLVEMKIKESLEDQKLVNKIKGRLFNIQRHSYYVKLEQRAGISKVRNRDVDQGVFGYIKSYKISPRLLSLSNPHKVSFDEFDKSDYRGLISKDYPKIINQSTRHDFQDNPKPIPLNSELEETIQSISDFEKKLLIISNPCS